MGSKNNIAQINVIVNSVMAQINKEEEYVTFNVRTQSSCVDKNFEITHKEMNAIFIESGNDTIGKIKGYIIRNVRLDCGLLFSSINKISRDTGVSRSTVLRVFDNLQKDDMIRLFTDGVWAINPTLLRRGTGGKYMGLIRFYNKLPKKQKDEPSELEEKCKKIVKLRNA